MPAPGNDSSQSMTLNGSFGLEDSGAADAAFHHCIDRVQRAFAGTGLGGHRVGLRSANG